MANQMTPAEMRETAKRLRGDAGPRGTTFDDQQAQDERAGADALDRLAAVIDLCEAELATTDPDGLTPSGQVARGILRAARGDTTNENRSE